MQKVASLKEQLEDLTEKFEQKAFEAEEAHEAQENLAQHIEKLVGVVES